MFYIVYISLYYFYDAYINNNLLCYVVAITPPLSDRVGAHPGARRPRRGTALPLRGDPALRAKAPGGRRLQRVPLPLRLLQNAAQGYFQQVEDIYTMYYCMILSNTTLTKLPSTTIPYILSQHYYSMRQDLRAHHVSGAREHRELPALLR